MKHADKIAGWFQPLQPIALLALRIALAVPFVRSGLTKWDAPFKLSDSAVYLFTEEFRLHLFGREIPYPFPATAALLSACAEILLPAFLVLGLGTRAAAIALLGMTAIIQLTVPEGWANFHLPWAAISLTLACFGAGAWSVDGVIKRLW
jgi:putative oxidoreductase